MTLPPKPNMLTDAERATLDPRKHLTPEQKALFLATLASGLQRQLQDPRLQPIQVHVHVRPTGFTLTVDLEQPAPNNLTLPGAP